MNRIPYAAEMKLLIDEVSAVIRKSKDRGYMPTFSVKGGRLGMVACCRFDPDKRKPGRPCKDADLDDYAEPHEVDVEVS